jgi:hypothetical protein
MAAQRVNIEFEISPKVEKRTEPCYLVHGYPSQGRAYNPVWDVIQKLPIYTKTKKSKSWFSAGWYRVKKGRNWATVQDPKLIVLQRYPYQGPFYTKESADDHTSK